MTSVIQPTYKIVEEASALLANKFACLELTIRALNHAQSFFLYFIIVLLPCLCLWKKKKKKANV